MVSLKIKCTLKFLFDFLGCILFLVSLFLCCDFAYGLGEVDEGLTCKTVRIEGDWSSGIATFADALYEWDLSKETNATFFS